MFQNIKISLLLFLLFTVSCEKELERIDDFFVEFSTVTRLSGSIVFKLDNDRQLIPEKLHGYDGAEGQRVILNYTPLEGANIKINQVLDIYTGEINESNQIELAEKDPVKIQSVWVSGGYLNLIAEIEYHSKAHKIGVVRNSQQSPSDLYFVHSREGDPPGYSRKLYASFLISSLKEELLENKFKFHINTIDGERIYEFEF